MAATSTGGTPIQTYARIGGVLLVISLIAGGFGEGFAPGQLIVSGDATATAHHVVASATLFRTGFAAYLVEAVCDVSLTMVLFILLRPVHFAVAFLAVLLRVTATILFAVGEAFYFLPSLLQTNDAYLKSFTQDQLNTLTLLSLNFYSIPGFMSILFYGLGSICLGALMFRSTYLPKVLGVLWIIGGLGFVSDTFLIILAPQLPVAPLMLLMIIGIIALGVWLLVRGVDAAKWGARAKLNASAAEA